MTKHTKLMFPPAKLQVSIQTAEFSVTISSRAQPVREELVELMSMVRQALQGAGYSFVTRVVASGDSGKEISSDD